MSGDSISALKVLQVIASLAPRYGGPTTSVVGLSRALAKRGHHVEIFTTDRGGPPGDDADDLNVHCFPVWKPDVFAVSPQLARALHRRVAEFDIVHVHSLYLFHTLVACAAARREHVPYIVRPHGTLDPYHRQRHRLRKALYDRAFERRNLAGAAAIHYTSDDERLHAERAGAGGHGVVAPLGIDVEVYGDGAPSDAAWKELDGRTVITYLGRITAKKGLDVLVDAFARVAALRRDADLVVAGPDDENLAGELRARVAAHLLTGRVAIVGAVNGPRKVALLRRSRVFVLPSLDENFGVAAVEAIAAGVPVVVTAAVATHRQIASAGAGIVVERTPEAVADAVLRIISDAGYAAELSANAEALAAREFSWTVRVLDIERMYAEAVGQS